MYIYIIIYNIYTLIYTNINKYAAQNLEITRN